MADETVSFALDGSSYEIVLSSANPGKLRDAFAQFVGAARRAGLPAGRGRSGGMAPRAASRAGGGENAAIREWANGHAVSERGRISGQVRDAYAAATS